MSTTGTKTVRDIVTMALRKAGFLGFGEAMPSEDAEAAMEELNLMLKAWQNMGYSLWTQTGGSLTLTTAASYTLSPVRPLRILSARFSNGTSEIPMASMTRDEYDSLPIKTSVGTPTQYHYDRQREAAKLYIWPVLVAATGQTIEYTYEREVEDITGLNDVIDYPSEWWEAIVLNLAARLVETAPTGKPPTLMLRAEQALMQAAAFDRAESVFFCGEY